MSVEDQAHIPEDMRGEKSTHIAILLDRSGSMGAIRQEAIDGFNDQVESIRENADKGGHTTVSFYVFGGTYASESGLPGNIISGQDPLDPPYGDSGVGRSPVETKFKFKEPGSLPRLTHSNYIPNGMTPMYDAVGRAMKDLEAMDDGHEQTAFLMVIVSDGRENHSRNWNADQISSKVTELQNTGRWTFVYICANQDLAEATALGFKPRNVVNFTASAAGARGMSAGTVAANSAYFASRAAGETQVDSYGETVAENNPDEESKTAG